jgi:hypothetical protein
VSHVPKLGTVASSFPARQTRLTELRELQGERGWEPVLRALVGGRRHGTLAPLRLPPNLVANRYPAGDGTDSPD